MADQYSEGMSGSRILRRVLALDTGSPLVSVAVAESGRTLAQRSVQLGESSRLLLALIDEVLVETGLQLRHLDGIVALQGPGSFTGLRVGLATVLGFHQASEIPATAVPTLEILALQAATGPDPSAVVGAVNALRGEWFAQPFSVGDAATPLAPARCCTPRQLLELGPGTIAGFGLSEVEELASPPHGIRVQEPGPLAPVASVFASSHRLEWDPKRLTEPIYQRPPAITPSRRAAATSAASRPPRTGVSE